MRVVSLVPSITETLFALGLGTDEVVGRTAFCVHPSREVEAVRKVGGTKTPSLRSIRALEPDVVILEREENTLRTHRELEEAGLRTLVLHVLRVADVPSMLRELGEAVGRSAAGEELARRTEEALRRAEERASRLGPGPCTLPLIWNEPLMAVAPSRYGGDILLHCGFRSPILPAAAGGYPRVTPELLGEMGVELLLLASEPHEFTDEEAAAVCDAVAAAGHARPHPLLVDGEDLTWFGVRTARALQAWTTLRERTATAG